MSILPDSRDSNTDYDGAYHQLFDHPKMIAELIDGFVEYELIRILDLNKMQRVNAKLHAEGLQRRDGDIIYRIPREDGGSSLYVYLMLEFQSSSDRWMAVRMLAYAALLYQHIIRQEKLGAGDKLPPILPVVLYNGSGSWTAPSEVRELIAVDTTMPLRGWQPQFKYYLLNENALDLSKLRNQKGPVSLLFQIERAKSGEELVALVDTLVEQLKGEQFRALRRTFATWLIAVLLPSKGVRLDRKRLEDLSEVRSMLAENVQNWRKNWKEQGLAEGREEGRIEGRIEGREEGRVEGLAEALLVVLVSKFGRKEMWAPYIENITEPEEQDRLLAAVAVAQSVEEVLALFTSNSVA